jgi:hypothetical protein
MGANEATEPVKEQEHTIGIFAPGALRAGIMKKAD